MKIHIEQTITKTLDENRKEISSRMLETYIIYPEEGKKLKDMISGKIIDGHVCVSSKAKIKNFEEI